MKKILYTISIVFLICIACKKAPADPTIHLPQPPAYMDSLQAYLRLHLHAADYAGIDLTRCVLSKQGKQWFWKLGIKQKPAATDFLLLQSDSLGHFTRGRWIALSGLSVEKDGVHGSIRLSALDRVNAVASKISGGYIEALHPFMFNPALKTGSHPDPYQELQEVIVVAYRPAAANNYSFNTYMLFQSIITDIGGAGFFNTAIYTGTAEPGSSNTGIDQSPQIPGTYPANDLPLNIENSPYLPGIDLAAWLKCFQSIPDEGASFSITLCGDLPVDDDPSINVNLYTGATGHCFLQLQKTNGAQSITQILGFTAQNALSAMFNPDEFLPSKTVDNAGHKYDASITMHINAAAFTTVMEKMQQLSASMPYSITRFDCLDYGLAVLNAVRGTDPLVLPHMPIPGNVYTQISTGERLFELLNTMKEQGDPESPQIYVGGPVFAGSSHGPCN